MMAPHREIDLHLLYVPIDPGFQGLIVFDPKVVPFVRRVIADDADPDQWGMLDEIRERLRECGYRGRVMIDLDDD